MIEVISRLPIVIQIAIGFWLLYAAMFFIVRGARHAKRILDGVEYTPIDEID